MFHDALLQPQFRKLSPSREETLADAIEPDAGLVKQPLVLGLAARRPDPRQALLHVSAHKCLILEVTENLLKGAKLHLGATELSREHFRV